MQLAGMVVHEAVDEMQLHVRPFDSPAGARNAPASAKFVVRRPVPRHRHWK